MAEERPAGQDPRSDQPTRDRARDGASMTYNPLVAWGVWMADRHGSHESAPGWLPVALLGVPIAVIVAVVGLRLAL